MAQPTNTYDTYDIVGEFEDLEDKAYMISPTQTPFVSATGRIKVSFTNHEWLTDALASASATNHVIEGDDATTDAQTAAARVGNYTNISDKVILVTGTSQAVKSAGNVADLYYLKTKAMKELKRDMESLLTQNNASVAGNATTARELGSFESWLTTNDDRAGDGAQGGASGSTITAPTDGTQRAFTETMLKTVARLCFNAGGEPSVLMVGPWNKQVVSGFTGNATREVDAKAKALFAGIDVYNSDFGELRIVPNRFSRDRSALFIDYDYVKVGYLRPIGSQPLAKTGDSERVQVLAEYTLVVGNEAAHGIVADLSTS